jgi:hypothetical protein
MAAHHAGKRPAATFLGNQGPPVEMGAAQLAAGRRRQHNLVRIVVAGADPFGLLTIIWLSRPVPD